MLKHWVWLATRKGVGINGRAALLRLFGSAEQIYAMDERAYLAEEQFDRRWLNGLSDKSLESAETMIAKCDDLGIRLLTYADEEYPNRLRNIHNPPAVLYYRGTLPDFDNEAVIGVVGSRRCSAYGLLHAKQFSKLIAASGGIVVSGGARGIDTMALYGALESAMPVVCVVGNGLDVTYPRENKRLFEEIAQHGCMISEFPPSTPPEAGNFPVRNRIISGLSLGVLVVEAPEKSGALITANHALEQGRDVYAIPGNIGVKHCEGSNRLIREGAIMADNGWDVLRDYVYRFPDKLSDGRQKESIERLYAQRFRNALPVYSPVAFGESSDKKHIDNPPPKTYSEEKEAELSEDEKTILRLLTQTPTLADELVARSGIPAARLMTALTMLQIKGLAEKTAGNRFFRK